MAKVQNIAGCEVILSANLSACGTCTTTKSTRPKCRKTSRPDPSSERLKLVSTQLLRPVMPKEIGRYVYTRKLCRRSQQGESSLLHRRAASRFTNSRLGHFSSTSASGADPTLRRFSKPAQFEVVLKYIKAFRTKNKKHTCIYFSTHHLCETYGLTIS